ncbi:hypothetical protein BCV69DRAFT_282034 [Microstroma glucosiphilum]|uniref:Uncharacterized protein n=1 Tax=Pseudomicrostroma glucosiphilum TaxID=1684307 RepID=A0A316U7S7_9BASI|nr:hypothetical protein BCV69DRAFT_282034 [Pseudomicrostroma glucosiphilum]PWN21299.1 hypothetical protein BCV69DRAFT_282034 [Pseudomicrostroma glucosiphilum]
MSARRAIHTDQRPIPSSSFQKKEVTASLTGVKTHKGHPVRFKVLPQMGSSAIDPIDTDPF